MLVVAVVTGVTLYFAERRAGEEMERNLDRSFRDSLAALHEAREVRLALLTERCRSLARSVRIRAALEESSAEDLYANADIELGGLLERGPPDPSDDQALRAKFLRFLDPRGALIARPRADPAARPEVWEARLALPGVPSRQESGYLAAKTANGTEELTEIIATAIVATDTREVIGAIVLGFRPLELTRSLPGGIGNGIWLEGRLHLPALPEPDRGPVGVALAGAIKSTGPAGGSFAVELDGGPHQLFYQQVNPGSLFPPAYEVCLYPLALSLARQSSLRWQIIGAAALLLLGGLAASHFISARLAEPVTQLAAASVELKKQQVRAETELELTNEELSARNVELQQALADLRSTQKQVIQQERLSALGQMASGIAHDFNNALVPILGFSQLMQMKPDLLANPAQSKRYLDLIQTSAQDAASVVSRLHEFSRANTGSEKFVAVDLTRIVGQAVNLTQPRWKDQAQSHGATIRVARDLATTPPVAGDESALREALTNLIFNAVDAMPDGGVITIRTRQTGESVRLEVADTGTGMTEEVRQRCLEPFFSTKGQRGTGLGLAMVFGIVQRHCGGLEIESALGKGTTFVLTLPRYHSDAAPIAEKVAAPPIAPLRVLVVDDEPAVRELLVAALEADGHTVEGVARGEDGLRRFKAAKFDLVVTDKAMPGMSGDQLAIAIKEISPPTPIILLTGFGQFLDQEKLAGVALLVSKPIDLFRLREAVATALKSV